MVLLYSNLSISVSSNLDRLISQEYTMSNKNIRLIYNYVLSLLEFREYTQSK